jgi:hypothetical protein
MFVTIAPTARQPKIVAIAAALGMGHHVIDFNLQIANIQARGT